MDHTYGMLCSCIQRNRPSGIQAILTCSEYQLSTLALILPEVVHCQIRTPQLRIQANVDNGDIGLDR